MDAGSRATQDAKAEQSNKAFLFQSIGLLRYAEPAPRAERVHWVRNDGDNN
jgi:hypothetical protein